MRCLVKSQRLWAGALGALVLGAGFGLGVLSGMGGDKTTPKQKQAPDTAAEFVQQKEVPANRPEQKLNKHDRSDVFDPEKAPPQTKNRRQPRRQSGAGKKRPPPPARNKSSTTTTAPPSSTGKRPRRRRRR